MLARKSATIKEGFMKLFCLTLMLVSLSLFLAAPAYSQISYHRLASQESAFGLGLGFFENATVISGNLEYGIENNLKGYAYGAIGFVNGVAAAGSGKNWTLNLAGLNLRAGRATLNIHWANKDGTAGAARIALTIQRTDTTAPTIVLSSVSNNDIDVDLVKLNREGITIAFSENVREGDISIRIERGRALSWLVDWSANSVTIIPARANQQLELETSYEIRVSTADDSNNRLNKTISFTTKIVK